MVLRSVALAAGFLAMLWVTALIIDLLALVAPLLVLAFFGAAIWALIKLARS